MEQTFIKPCNEQQAQQYGNSCMTFLFTCSPRKKNGDLFFYFTAAHYLASFTDMLRDIGHT